MAGTVPISCDLSMADLAATLTRHEQLAFEQIPALTFDATQARNFVTTIDQAQQLGALAVCASGTAGQGPNILLTTVYISGTKTAIDLYRLPGTSHPD